MKHATLTRLLSLTFFCFLGLGLLLAQSKQIPALMGKAPVPGESLNQEKVQPTVSQTSSRMQEEQMNIQTLVTEMKANQNNAQYDMAAALTKLKKSPFVIYPLNHFDPDFPIVFRTGDPKTDWEAYTKAKQAYLDKQ